MKRFITLFLALGLVFSFSSCGGWMKGKFHKENWGPKKPKKGKRGKNYSYIQFNEQTENS